MIIEIVSLKNYDQDKKLLQKSWNLFFAILEIDAFSDSAILDNTVANIIQFHHFPQD